MRRAALAVAALCLCACATAQVYLPPEDVTRVQHELAGANRYLRQSLFVTPFFGDATKKLLSAAPPDEVDLLANPSGTPVNPGAVEATFPAGTPLRIKKVEFPTSTVMAERVLYTPRSLVWLYVQIGETKVPHVLVLRPGLKEESELLAEVDHLLAKESPAAALEALPDTVREAVKAKRALVEMSAEALEMAWGTPQRKKVELDGDKRRETWSWGKRTAVLVDGHVTELKAP